MKRASSLKFAFTHFGFRRRVVSKGIVNNTLYFPLISDLSQAIGPTKSSKDRYFKKIQSNGT